MQMDATEIIRMLEEPNEDWSVVRTIRDKAEISEVIAALQKSTNPDTRQSLCDILGFRAEVGLPNTKPATSVLIEALRDPVQSIRSSAADALGKIADPMAGPALLDQYHKEEEGSPVRQLLASAIGASRYRPAIPTLLEALSSSDEVLRRAAVWGLRHLKAQEAREPLQKALLIETTPLTVQTIKEALQEIENAR